MMNPLEHLLFHTKFFNFFTNLKLNPLQSTSFNNKFISIDFNSWNCSMKAINKHFFFNFFIIPIVFKYDCSIKYIFHENLVLFSSLIISTKGFLTFSRYCSNENSFKYVSSSLSYST